MRRTAYTKSSSNRKVEVPSGGRGVAGRNAGAAHLSHGTRLYFAGVQAGAQMMLNRSSPYLAPQKKPGDVMGSFDQKDMCQESCRVS